MQQISKQINNALIGAKKVLIIPHQHPDGDALGSMSALAEHLRAVGKPFAVFCATPVSPRWQFIPNAQLVSQDESHFVDPQIDTVVVLDSGDLRYAGIAENIAGHRAAVINIDHHPTNEKYGHLNLVVPTASATAEILYYFFKHNNASINAAMATALLSGIVTDTGNFTNAATTESALFVASDLLRRGANLRLIINETVKNQSVPALKLWGAALARLNKDEKQDITYTFLTRRDFIEHGADESEGEGIANFLNNLSGSKIMVILRETDAGQIKGSLRTTRDDVDVSVIAKKLGGGGHKKAAGFTAVSTIDEVLEKILLGA